MGIGDFLTGAAIGAGDIAKGWINNEQQLDLKRELMALEEARDRRALEYKEQMRRGGATWDSEQADAKRKRTAEEFSSAKEGLLRSAAEEGARELYGEDAPAYEDMADEEKAYFRSQKGLDEKTLNIKAGEKTGLLSPKDIISMQDKDAQREMTALIQQGKLDNALAIANMKGDVSMMIAAMRAASKGGSDGEGKLPSDAKMIEYLVDNKIAPDKQAAYKMIKEGKAAEMENERVTYEDGRETKREVTTKRRAGDKPQMGDDKFTPGKKYKDRNGIVKTYRGNGVWE